MNSLLSCDHTGKPLPGNKNLWFTGQLVTGSIVGHCLQITGDLVTNWLPGFWLPGFWLPGYWLLASQAIPYGSACTKHCALGTLHAPLETPLQARTSPPKHTSQRSQTTTTPNRHSNHASETAPVINIQKHPGTLHVLVGTPL